MKKKPFYIIISILSAVILGIFTTLGVIFIQEGTASEVDYDKISEDEIIDDIDVLYAQYKAIESDKYETTFKPFQMALIALENLKTFDDTRVLTTGKAVADGITQEISGTSLRVGNSYFNESISASFFVKVAWRIYQSDDEVKTYKGKYKDLTHANFDVEPTTYTLDSFIDTWGRTYDKTTPYIISSKTTLNESLSKTSEGDFECSLNLDPELSVVNYVKQMKKISNLNKYPTFSSVKLIFTLDKDLFIKKIDIDEEYVAIMLGSHNTHATMTDTYSYNTGIKIPSIEEAANYEKTTL